MGAGNTTSGKSKRLPVLVWGVLVLLGVGWCLLTAHEYRKVWAIVRVSPAEREQAYTRLLKSMLAVPDKTFAGYKAYLASGKAPADLWIQQSDEEGWTPDQPVIVRTPWTGHALMTVSFPAGGARAWISAVDPAHGCHMLLVFDGPNLGYAGWSGGPGVMLSEELAVFLAPAKAFRAAVATYAPWIWVGVLVVYIFARRYRRLAAELLLILGAVALLAALLQPGLWMPTASDQPGTLMATYPVSPASILVAVLLFGLSIIALIAVIARDRRVPTASPTVACLNCGYNLTGNTSGVCPECGTALPPPAVR